MNQEESIRFATKYLEDLLSFFGINVAISSSHDEAVIQLAVPSNPLNSLLIGKNAGNLRALQHIVSAALFARNAELTRVNIDIADYRKQHAEQTIQRGEQWIQQVRRSGESLSLSLNPADRRLIHKLAEDYSDITTHSEGVGLDRRLIISKVKLSENL